MSLATNLARSLQGHVEEVQPNCCKLYDHENLTGDSLTVCLESGQTVQDFNLSDLNFNDRMESWECGKSVQYSLCYDYTDCSLDTGGYWWGGKTGETGAGAIRGTAAGMNNWFSSIWLREYDAWNKGAVTIFRHPDCQGDSGSFYASETLGRRMGYNRAMLEHGKIWSDDASSIMVPFGYSVELFDGEAMYGSLIEIEGPMYQDDTERMRCINLDGLHDRTSSIEVWKNRDLGNPAVGSWRLIRQAEQEIVYQVSVGVVRKSEQSDTTSDKYAIQVGLEMGIEFSGQEGKVNIGMDYESSHEQVVMESLEYSQGETVTSSCTPLEGENGVAMYQWVVQTAGNNEQFQAMTETNIIQCRYGSDLYRSAPKCPPDRCADSSCETCTAILG